MAAGWETGQPPQRRYEMRILILRNTICGGQPVFEGQVVDADEEDARLLIQMKKAKIAPSAGDERTLEAPEKAVLPKPQKRGRK